VKCLVRHSEEPIANVRSLVKIKYELFVLTMRKMKENARQGDERKGRREE
jgi:hypothetical protein